MQGIELARRYYDETVLPMLTRDFAPQIGRIAAGLAGHGSECFGYDDEISSDHDFEPGYCLWLTEADFTRFGARLQAAYDALPRAYSGQKSALGGGTRGVKSIPEFFRPYLGGRDLPQTPMQWLYLPSEALAEATNGVIFTDPVGEFSAIRETLTNGMPKDVWLKKISACAALMAQTGQYNYARCLNHGQAGAAMLALTRFVEYTCEMIFLLNRRHKPYYKWTLRALRDLPILSDLADPLEFLLTDANDAAGQKIKREIVEDICGAVIRRLKAQGLTDADDAYLEPHAFSVRKRINDPQLSALHLMEGI